MEPTDDAILHWAYHETVSCEPDDEPEGADRFASLVRRAGEDGFGLLRIENGSAHAAMRIYVDPARRRRGSGHARGQRPARIPYGAVLAPGSPGYR